MKPLAHLLAIVFALLLAGAGAFLVFHEHAQLATSIGLQVLVGICLVGAPCLAIPAETEQAGAALVKIGQGAIALYKQFKGGQS